MAHALARTGATPNQVSIASIAFAGVGAALLVVGTPLALVGAAAMVQLRLLCNLLDGLIAVEGGKATPAGALYNEVPDRIADSILLVALGYAAGIPWLGWAAALAAALTAYIRTLGGALGHPQDFRGPMAKQQRMAALTLACLVGAAEAALYRTTWTFVAAAALIAAGSIVTCATRLRAIARRLSPSYDPSPPRPSTTEWRGLR